MNITIRNLQETIFRRFKARAVEEDMKLGDALTQAMEMWLGMRKEKPKHKLTGLPMSDWGKGNEHVSKNVDKILYG